LCDRDGVHDKAITVPHKSGHQGTAIVVAITGASGAPYGVRLIEVLLELGYSVELLISRAGLVVLQQECGLAWEGSTDAIHAHVLSHFGTSADRLRYRAMDDWGAPGASGSGGIRQMVVCPCSMGTLAAIAHGLSDSLLERTADVMLKERRTLVLVPRETPLSALHLQNMLRLVRLGAVVLPAAPGFYHRPVTVAAMVDFMVARVLDQLAIPHTLMTPWGDRIYGANQNAQ
jgi:4-hydroxy-3-polyprenylbenzoate decarboxylase